MSFVRLVGFVRLMRARSDFPRPSLHIDMHETPVPMQEGDLVNEIVSGAAEPRRERLGLALRASELERREWLKQVTRLDHLPRLGGVETGRLRRNNVELSLGGLRRRASHRDAPHPSGVSRRAHKGPPSPGAAKHGERHDGKASVENT